MTFSSMLIYAAALTATALGHMEMIKPCARYTPHGDCPSPPSGQSLDYSLSSPLDPGAPLCKHTVPYSKPVETWTAGQDITVDYYPNAGAAHGGGHCQFSVSYDNSKTFVVVHNELKYCFFNGPTTSNTPEKRSYTFTLPSNLPSSDKAVFAWTWVNAIGNREFYMNCADVAIKGNSNSYTGQQMVIANHNGYPTIPAFNGDYDTGIDLYTNAKNITVTGSGSSSGSNDDGSGIDGGDSAAEATAAGGEDASAGASAGEDANTAGANGVSAGTSVSSVGGDAAGGDVGGSAP
ncbi:hypothetical protein GGI25_000537 [Coemansia spiralis]|uniref:Chitin-binding type-4 domain-containing protein n=2 Tax=Coemansia TaxID=4863 RepID=A0A9W8G783_9FUNG|nr:hypothetical protein EDC05_000365 [Coemansia umbellata]KAJ2625442.1 hypothetical protein GGI26_000582 [Coemansia sp. RSA 1358]KAJ2680564.1 hypothetical protein GGI25_000537 [Coemansia spiralis]